MTGAIQRRIIELVRRAELLGFTGLTMSVRELAIELGCKRRAVLRALERLEHRGELEVQLRVRVTV